jgi:hypothetical protein
LFSEFREIEKIEWVWHRVVWRGAANAIAFKLFEAQK